MYTFFTSCLLVTAITILGGCSGGSSGSPAGAGDGENVKVRNRINWSSVPSEFNPRIETVRFNLDRIKVVDINVFGFNDDVEVVYRSDLPKNEGSIEVYTVWKRQAAFAQLSPSVRGSSLDLKAQGSFQCSIEIRNQEINSLDGGCYVRLVINLPTGVEVEVYNANELLTKKYFVIETDEFLEQIEEARWDEARLKTIQKFIDSYAGTTRSVRISSKELGTVLDQFSFSDGKLQSLRMLHRFVIDRERLSALVDEKFKGFSRDEARKIIGN